MDRVLLINMPFHACHYPSIGLSLLKAGLAREGIPCDISYLNLAFAEYLNKLNHFEIYDLIAKRFAWGGLGELVFSHDLFNDGQGREGRSFEEILQQYKLYWVNHKYKPGLKPWKFQDFDISEIAKNASRLADLARDFLGDCINSIDWNRYRIIGFSSMFQQNVASLCLAKRIKILYPEKIIVFGGKNCEGEMATSLSRNFPFVDVVCSGEGDFVFPLLTKRLLGGKSIEDIPNIVYHRENQSCSNLDKPAPPVVLDDLPFPDYDEYFLQLDKSQVHPLINPRLLFETSRGCWWGAKSHCTFCGLNNAGMEFRFKSKDRVIDELSYLSERHDIRQFLAVDNILSKRYFKDLLPELKKRERRWQLSFCIKANLSKEMVCLLKDAGICEIVPGIESLSTPILRLMKKGCTALQNIQLLKWASQAGIRVDWTLLLGFPKEDPQEYQRMAEIIPALNHLQAPNGCSLIRLERFSPYFMHPEDYGICRVRPLESYRHIYPFDENSLSQLAYFFDFDYVDGRSPLSYVQPAVRAVEEWQQNHQLSCVYWCDGDRAFVRDERPCSQHPNVLLRGAQKEIYEYCDQVRSFSAIAAFIKKRFEKGSLENFLGYLLTESRGDVDLNTIQGEVLELNKMRGGNFDRYELEEFLRELIDLKLMLREGNQYLSLALRGRESISER